MDDKLRQDKFDKLDTKNIDLHGRRVINASRSVDKTDYVIKSELTHEIEKVVKNITSQIINITSTTSAANWPIGSIFITVSSSNPNSLLGFGTWTRFAKGRVLVGLDETNPLFDTVEEEG